jgi:phage baseplate assembly protein W
MWKDRIILLCLTQIGERIMLPTFGTHVPSSAFENQFDAVEMCRSSVIEAFAKWLPDLVFLNITGELDPDTSQLVLEIYYNDPTGTPNAVTLRTALFTRFGDIIKEVVNG